jgi:hypothetical protein
MEQETPLGDRREGGTQLSRLEREGLSARPQAVPLNSGPEHCPLCAPQPPAEHVP